MKESPCGARRRAISRKPFFMPDAASLQPPVSKPTDAVGWRLEQSYAQLPAMFHVAIAPTPVAAPRLVVLNQPLAQTLGLDPAMLGGEEGAAIFSGNRLPPGSQPLAQAYAGHQYGHF